MRLSTLCRLLGAGLAFHVLGGTVELVTTNAAWRYRKGTQEASTPDLTAWRLAGFGEVGWTSGAAPFSYGEAAITLGTRLPDMANGYSSVFLRKSFAVENPGQVASLELSAVCDDGFLAWINGHEVARYNAPAGEPRFNSLASANAPEPVGFQHFPIASPELRLVPGENLLAIQVFNVNLGSSDLVFDAGLSATTRESGPPTVVGIEPLPGLRAALTEITVTFSEPVTGVAAEHFLVNGRPATSVSGSGAVYTFQFEQPAYGPVQIRWSTFHAVRDFETPPQAFDLAAPQSTWAYELLDPEGPAVVRRLPPPGLTVRALSQVEVTFNKAVAGLEASDLLLNGAAATNVTGIGAGPFLFQFPTTPTRNATLSWSEAHGIVSDSPAPHPFVGASWSYPVAPEATRPPVEITEFMADNLTAYRDEDKDPEDWIELHNPGPVAVDLVGWSFSNTRDEPGRWVFPSVTLPAHGYLVVFASAKDRVATVAGAPLHTNFKLNPNGGYVGLFPPELPRQAASELEYPLQGPDHSFGRENGLGAWGYYPTGTPGARNPVSRIRAAVSDVHFSVPRGFFNRPFNLSLHCPTAGAVIRYTTDSSVPTLTNGFAYTEPILINATRIVRAAAFLTNALPSRVQTHSFLMNISASRLRLPSVSLVTSSNHLYGRTGIMEPPNPRNRGAAWERPVSVEWMRPEDNGGFQVNAGIRVQGGDYVRGQYNYRGNNLPFNKYSFRLYFRGEYGPGRLSAALFPDTTQTSFDVISLRAGMNDHSNPFLTDEFVRGLAREVGQPASVGTFVNLYINGVYKGYYNPCERIDEEFLRAYHGGGDGWDILAQSGEVQEGTSAAWNALKTFANTRNLTNQTEYLALSRQLDLTNFVDYLCPLIYVDNDDWPHNNWRVARERVAGSLLRFYVWDAEWACGVVNGHAPSYNTINNQLSSTAPPWGSSEIQQLFNKLKRIPEFKLLFADRVHQHFFDEGALTDARIRQRYQTIKNRLNGTISGFNDRIGTSWIPQRRRYVLEHLRLAGFLASSNAPGFNIPSGPVPAGFALQMTNVSGAVYYTTNGTDPRIMFTGAVSPDAFLFDPGQPVVLDRDLEVGARSLAGTNWSALARGRYQVERLGWPVRFTEIMYHPPGGDAFEFVELSNVGGISVDVSGWSLEGVEFRFPEPVVVLQPGERLVLASDDDPAAFAARYPEVDVAGWFAGNLDNGGERLALVDRLGTVVTSVTYGDGGAWPAEADGAGYSLEFSDPDASGHAPANWHASARVGGTPGAVNSAAVVPSVRLNEVYAAGQNNAETPVEGEFDWLELFNAQDTAVQLGGWRLEGEGSTEFTFPPNTILAPSAYLRVWADNRSSPGEFHTGFGLKQTGETLRLADTQSRRVDAVTFGLQARGFTLGRLGPDATWDLAEPTPGAPNESAAVASAQRVVINEFLANPPTGGDDWIELLNTDTQLPVALQGLWLATSNALEQIASRSFLAPAGFGVLKTDGRAGADRLGFKLPAAGDAILLLDRTGAQLQRLDYRNALTGVSAGLLPDGTGLLTSFPNSASPGAPNYLATNTTLQINEIMARAEAYRLPDGESPVDWIELANLGAQPVPLAGFSLSLGKREPGEWGFPPGSSLPARGFLVVQCDGARPASTTTTSPLNLGRNLSDLGGAVHWYDPRGQLLDSVEFGFPLADRPAGRVGEGWELLADATPGGPNGTAAPLGDATLVRWNEWLALGEGDDWVEVFNPSPLPVNLGGFRLSDDPSLAGQTNHVLPALTFVPPLGWVWWRADGQPDKGPDHLRFNLDGAGETLRIYTPTGTLVDSVDLRAQTSGVSEGRFPDGAESITRFPETASRGAANFTTLSSIVISEILTHTDPPFEDAIELRNQSNTPIELGGWFLSDQLQPWRKYRIPVGTTLPAQGYLVFYEDQFNAADLGRLGFNLNSAHGGEVWLSAADADGAFLGQRVGIRFGAARNGVSFGSFATSQGPDVVPLSRPTFGEDAPLTVAQFRAGQGSPNAYPRVGPVVINEIHFHPVSRSEARTIEAPDEEFIELWNLTAQALPLFDPEHPANPWRLAGGVDFDFPAAASLPPRAYALVVGFNPATDAAARASFVAKYEVPAGTLLFGPFAGRLANEGETIELEQPDAPQRPPHPDAGFVPYVLVERVRYGIAYPWPTGTDGAGLSLHREEAGSFGNEPFNWRAARPSPGRAMPHAGEDADGDGLPDDWEFAHGLDPDLAAGDDGAEGDPDGDGLVNLREFQTGNAPREFSLVILAARFDTGRITLTFNAAAGYSYRLELRRGWNEAAWEEAGKVLSSETGELEVAIDLLPGLEAAYYRVVLP